MSFDYKNAEKKKYKVLCAGGGRGPGEPTIQILCPFCGHKRYYYIFSMAGLGNRCKWYKCNAMHRYKNGCSYQEKS